MKGKKKVVFVGGTVRSGTTILNLLLGNRPKTLALGELHAIVKPTMPKHFKLLNEIKGEKPWNSLKGKSQLSVYESIFKHFQNVEILVDSSKKYPWIRKGQNLRKQGVKVYNVLIYKNLDSLAVSFLKRNTANRLIPTYLNYHKSYFTSLENDVFILPYSAIVEKDASVMTKLCEYLEYDYTNEIWDFWEKEQPNFFGSNSIYSVSDSNEDKSELNIRAEIKDSNSTKVSVESIINNKSELTQLRGIEKFLDDRSGSVLNVEEIPSKYKYRWLHIQTRVVVNRIKSYINTQVE